MLTEHKFDQSVLEKVHAEWFEPHKGVIGINEDGENTISTEGRLQLACKAGISKDMFNLFHEMGHFIEIDNSRCHRTDWGLKTGKTVRIGHQYVREGMFTSQAIDREIRVFAIQKHLHDAYGWSPQTFADDNEMMDIEYMAELCDWLDGIYNFYPANWRSQDGGSYSNNKAFARKLIACKIKEQAEFWTLDTVRAAWDAKVKVLKRKGKLPGHNAFYGEKDDQNNTGISNSRGAKL